MEGNRPQPGIDWAAPLRATWALVALMTAVHLVSGLAWWMAGRGGLLEVLVLGREIGFRVAAGGQYHPLIVGGDVWRLYTSVFLHADGLHLLVNGVALLALGRILEPWLGARRFTALFLAGGFAGSVMSQLVQVSQSDGASGGAFALLGLAVVLGWRERGALSEDDRRLLGPILQGFLLLNVVLSLVLPFVDAAGHLGGLALGVVLGLAVPTGAERFIAWSRAVEVAWIAVFAGICLAGWVFGGS
ncbi:MAG: rhomboid family intramembrane serine protease [Deltaproteobacteria bacterium]|nr:rhomboid family intramembrane serine protease [Deltaproteobacteria bacterium]MBW2253429.1 rhomboid family intramembrane serine protease [Deltaproteobacteria bacterium]